MMLAGKGPGLGPLQGLGQGAGGLGHRQEVRRRRVAEEYEL